MTRLPIFAAAAALTLSLGAAAFAEPVSVEAVMTPQEQMKFEFGDGSKHFVLAVRREGTAKGTGTFDGASVTEFGWHDIRPPVDGDPQGYLELTAENGDVAVLKWSVRAIFLAGDGKPELFDNGVWELTSGTGQFKDMAGVGSLVIKPAEGEARKFILEGELRAKP